jgi:hypothetical protein
MNIINGHVPLPNSFVARAINEKLTHREFRLYIIIGTEIYRFPETRSTLSKELSSRYLQSLTGIHHSHITRMMNKFEKKGLLKIVKSHIKGTGSLVILVLPDNNIAGAVIAPDKSKLAATIAPDESKSGATIAPNPINLSKKDHQESDLTDSNINIDQKEKKQPERKDIETSLNSSSSIKDRLISSKKSNLNMPAVNLLCPAGEAGNSDFSALGSVLANVIPNNTHTFPEQSSSTPVTVISIPVINKGKEILQSKGFNASNIQAITERIINGIKKNSPEKPVPYFIAACNNEKIKTTSEFVTSSTVMQVSPVVRPSIASGAPSVEKTRRYVNEFWKEERDSITTEEVLIKLTKTCPDKLNTVITNVTNDKKIQIGLSFMGEGEAKKLALGSIILAEFKKAYPGIVI